MKQIGNEASRSEEASGIFFDNGYNVGSYENVPVSVAWKIHEGKSYSVLDAIAYRATAVKKVREDKRTLSKISRILFNQLVNSPNTPSGIELKKVFGVNAPHYMGKQIIIVADKFLVSGSRDEGDTKVDSVEIVPISDLSSILQKRKDYVLKRASRIFRPSKGEVLQKAYSRARKGLILTIVLIALLLPLIFLSGTGAVFQISLTVDSVLVIAAITASLVIHELGIANFKKLLREELTAFQELPRLVSPQTISRKSEAFQEPPKQRTRRSSASKPITNKEPPKEEIEKYVEPLLNEGGNSSEFYAQRRDALWDLAQKAYAEGDWDNCTYHLKGAVSSALKEVYVKLTGKTAFGSPPQVAEFVCKKTRLNLQGFQQFFDGINTPQKLSEADFSRLFEQAHKLLTDLQSSASATAASKTDTVKKDAVKDQKELPRKELHSYNTVSAPRTEKKSSKMVKESGKRAKSKTGKKKSAKKESEKFNAEPEVPKTFRIVETEAEVTNCDSVIETMGADDNIKNELKRLFISRGGKAGSAILVVTQSPEVAGNVEDLKRKYPEVLLETYECAVNGKAQIIVSRVGEISSKIDYESPQQLEKLVRDHHREKGLNEFKTTGSTDDITGLLDE